MQVNADHIVEHLHQFRIHETVVIRDIQNVQSLVFEQASIFCAQAIGVFVFHDEDDVGPADIRWADWFAGVRAGAGRTGLEAGPTAPDRFRCGATPLIAAADEKEFGHS